MECNTHISIGMPVYNAEEYLALAITSVLVQSYKFWELIIIDDGSTDNSVKIARKFQEMDSRIRVISDGNNMKLAYRLNQVINEAKYDYIARMDADDLIHPNRLKIQIDFLRNNLNFDLVSSGVVSIDNKNKVYGYRNVDEIKIGFNKLSRSYPEIVHASILAKKSWYVRNNYDTTYSRGQDYELWCRTSSQDDLKLAVLPDLLYYYREEGNLDVNRLIGNYENGFKTYKKYKNNTSITDLLKVKAKKYTVKIIDKLGFLQKIASRRNRKSIDYKVLSNHQKTVDSIIQNSEK